MQQVADVETGNPDWRQIFAEWNIDYVIDVPGAPAVLALEVDSQWTEGYDDGLAVIMVKELSHCLRPEAARSVPTSFSIPPSVTLRPAVFWLDDPRAPKPQPPLDSHIEWRPRDCRGGVHGPVVGADR